MVASATLTCCGSHHRARPFRSAAPTTSNHGAAHSNRYWTPAKKKPEDVPLVPPSRVAFAASVGHVSSRHAYCCTLRKKRQPERRRVSRGGEYKEYKNNRRCTCRARLPPGAVLRCCRRPRCPGPGLFRPVPPGPDPSPISQSTGSCRRREGVRERTSNTQQSTRYYL